MFAMKFDAIQVLAPITDVFCEFACDCSEIDFYSRFIHVSEKKD